MPKDSEYVSTKYKIAEKIAATPKTKIAPINLLLVRYIGFDFKKWFLEILFQNTVSRILRIPHK